MEKGQVIELENSQKYAIADNINLDNKNYIYLVNLDNNSDICFAEYNSEKIIFVNDDNLYGRLIVEVYKNQKNN